MADIRGDVLPVSPDRAFTWTGITSQSYWDTNDDGSFDFLPDLSSASFGGVNLNGDASASDAAVAGDAAWDSVRTWKYWDFKAPVTVGGTYYGELVYGGSDARHGLRCTDLVIGDTATGVGLVRIEGAGGFCNDRDSLPQTIRKAIAWSQSSSYDPATVVYDDLGDATNHPYSGFSKVEQPAGNYNVWVGKEGFGRLEVANDSRMEIRHQLLVGGRYVSDVFTAGKGGALTMEDVSVVCYGRFLADTGAPETITAAEPSQVSALGVISLTRSLLHVRTGLVNAGLIVVRGAAGEEGTELSGVTSSITAESWVVGEETIVGKLVNDGSLVVQAGATLIVGCPIENSGSIYLESGAKLIVPSITGTGTVKCSPCCPAAVIIEGGAVMMPAKCQADFE